VLWVGPITHLNPLQVVSDVTLPSKAHINSHASLMHGVFHYHGVSLLQDMQLLLKGDLNIKEHRLDLMSSILNIIRDFLKMG
jgi:hypothetical protein